MVLVLVASLARSAETQAPATVESTYPGLVSGVLVSATLGDLPEGLLLRAGKVEIAAKALDDLLAKSPRALREQLRKNAVFLLDELAAEKLLLQAAADAAAKTQQELAGKADKEVIAAHLDSVLAKVRVTEAEADDFYRKNRDTFGVASLESAIPQIVEFLLGEKREAATRQYVRGLGKTYPITVSAPWVKEKAVLARDNPVDKARASGMPTMVDFGADGCRPCDLMAPVLRKLAKKHQSKANVLFVHVQKEQILAARYAITTIPVQVFFDKDGKEFFRHIGFFAEDEIEKKLAEAGVQ